MVILFILKKEIYRSGKITGAVRILKGHEMLPDDSTLVQHNISDGDTVRVLIEPERNIAVEVQCGPMVYRHEVNYSMTVKELKMFLIENNEVAFLEKDIGLIMQATNKDLKQELELKDDSMPLHYFTSDLIIKLKVIGPTIFIASQNPFGETTHHKIPKKGTVCDLKQIIMKSSSIPPFTDKMLKDSFLNDLMNLMKILLSQNNGKDISLFVTCGNDGYKKLDETDCTPLGELLSDGDVVYYVEDNPFSNLDVCNWPVYHQKSNVGTVRCNRIQNTRYETVRTIKLRIQDEMGIPANRLTVYLERHTNRTVNDEHKMDCGSYYVEIK